LQEEEEKEGTYNAKNLVFLLFEKLLGERKVPGEGGERGRERGRKTHKGKREKGNTMMPIATMQSTHGELKAPG